MGGRIEVLELRRVSCLCTLFKKSILWALAATLVAHLPSYCGNSCESKGETSTKELLGVKSLGY